MKQKRFFLLGFLLLLADLSSAQERRFRIYLIHHGWHAGIAFCQAQLKGTNWPAGAFFLAWRYIEVGWGEAGYYPHPDPGVEDALRAALWPTDAVLHIAAFDAPPAWISKRPMRQIELDSMAFQRLVAYVVDFFELDAQGRPQLVAPGLYGRESQFYAAKGRYHLFNNCNHWVARALRAAGLLVYPSRALTLQDLWRQLERLSQEVAPEQTQGVDLCPPPAAPAGQG